ncbi:TonB-dependent receptor [Marinicauda pacifica]|uniref:TonB-dependent receptor n=1 Tax=Marinicauda pacifica TaxID=1133559 RepID=UPI0035C84643
MKSTLLTSCGAAALVLCAAGASAQAQEASEPVRFEIPAGSMSQALDLYADQTGRELIYETGRVETLSAQGLSGIHDADAALSVMLDGTGLTYAADASGAVMVYASHQEPEPESDGDPEPVRRQARFDQAPADVVTVVGSQIPGLQTDGQLPVTIIDRDEIAAVAATSGDELYRSIPQMGDVAFNSTENVSGGINSARGDVASINLRALGTGNTLTLINGRRMVNHPGTQSENLVPVVSSNANAIPVRGVSRVEVLLDGASALYGSDAVAGVVNNVLRDDFDGLNVAVRYGMEPEISASESSIGLEFGRNFNQDRSNISVYASYLDRDPVQASERDFSANADLRDRLPEEWANDIQFRNNSNNSPWGAFTLLDPATGDPVSIPGVTTGSGGFNIRPAGDPDCTAPYQDGLCIAPGNGAGDVASRYNTNSSRTINNGVSRLNLFATADHDFDNGISVFAEGGYYWADSEAERSGSAQLSAERAVIPSSNYYNPFGAAGTNGRIDALGLPAAGYDVLLRRYRLVDAGSRKISVENTSWRALAGLEGQLGGFDWETAFLYSEAETDDTTTRTSNTLFADALAMGGPAAYNPFNGGGLPLSESGDNTPSDAGTIDGFLVPVSRISSTSLALWDVKLSRPDLFQLPAGSVGVALGLEQRRETFSDDRDPRLDGTIQFLAPETGELTSDVMGSSPTIDSSGARNVSSAFAELAVPVISPDMDIPLIQSIDVQLAVRHEDYDLFGAVTKPKVALAWRPSDFLLVRTAWSQGFKAPNLQQQFERSLERVNTRPDYVFCEADLRAGRIASFSDCDRSDSVVSQREGSTDLGPEESESFSAGVVFDAFFVPEQWGSFQFTADYWSIEQEDVVGIFGDDNHLVLDYLLRTRGQSNPAVVREAPTAQDIAAFQGTGLEPVGQIRFVEDNYTNLLPRTAEGIDYAFFYDLDDTRWGDFSLNVNVAQLLTFEQNIAPIEAEILAAQDAGEISEVANLSGVGDLIRQDGRPEWRWSASATWRYQAWGAGWFTSFVDDVLDTSATNDDTREYWTVDSYLRHNAYVQYTFGYEGEQPFRVRLGARNLFDEEPPLADESFGYMGSLHSSRGRFVYVDLRKSF